MTELEDALTEFRTQMLRKFELRAAKHPESTVTKDGNLARIDGGKLLYHYVCEIGERLYAEKLPPSERAAEDIDVANLAFLDWYFQSRNLAEAPR